MEAIRNAVQRLNTTDLSECILISTHEPCIMCSYVIRFHGIQRTKVYHENPVLSVGGIHSTHPILVDSTFWTSKSVPEVVKVK